MHTIKTKLPIIEINWNNFQGLHPSNWGKKQPKYKQMNKLNALNVKINQ